ncbi:hypothetical protein [Candidatus Accumulibacter sp. ACC003]|uniref:hypothetical protein n=1 Tax=Candidatus Accumulibacter sp. ACC003 TaxID=2823334 RepID=UPI0025C58D05|nr:hypothetical protein [Candidatus Accumulibacter sp. ACC003]
MNKPSLNRSAIEQLDRLGLPPNTHKVALACALLWTFRSNTDVYRLLALSGLQNSAGKAFTASDVKAANQQLRDSDLLVDENARATTFQLVDALRAPLYRQLLDTHPGNTLAQLIVDLDHFDPSRSTHYWPTANLPTAIAYVRARFHSGAPGEELAHVKNVLSRSIEWSTIVIKGILLPFDGPTFEHIEPVWRSQLADQAVATLCRYWIPDYLPIADWACEQLRQDPDRLSDDLRLALGDLAMQRGDADLLHAALPESNEGLDAGVYAAALVVDGQWAAGQAAFEAAFKQRKSETGAAKNLLPLSVIWLYPLSLLAQSTPKHLELARRFCVGEAGKRDPSPYDRWGRWVHAIDVRLGKAAIVRAAFQPEAEPRYSWALESLWAIVLSAWLGREMIADADPRVPLSEWRETIDFVRQRLQMCRLPALQKLLDGCEAVLDGRDPPAGFFVAGSGDKWREVLAALQALGGDQPAAAKGGESSRVLWELEIGSRGDLLGIRPLEQKRGQRAWGRARALSLVKLAGNQQLATCDAKVARALRAEPGYRNRYTIDLAAAIVALVGHPCIVLANSPEQFVELTEAAPELDLVRQGERFVMRVEPPLRPRPPTNTHDSQTRDDARRRKQARNGSADLRVARFTGQDRPRSMKQSRYNGKIKRSQAIYQTWSTAQRPEEHTAPGEHRTANENQRDTQHGKALTARSTPPQDSEGGRHHEPHGRGQGNAQAVRV